MKDMCSHSYPEALDCKVKKSYIEPSQPSSYDV